MKYMGQELKVAIVFSRIKSMFSPFVNHKKKFQQLQNSLLNLRVQQCSGYL